MYHVVSKKLTKLVGIKAALLYSYLLGKSSNDWISLECCNIENDCAMSYKEQKTAIKKLKEIGALDTKFKDLPRKLYYKTNLLF